MTWQSAVSEAVTTGPWSRFALRTRIAHALGRLSSTEWIDALADLLCDRWPEHPSPSVLQAQLPALLDDRPAPDDTPWSPPPAHVELGVALHQPMSQILTRQDLRALLDLSEGELEWFADCQSRLHRGKQPALRHYRYRITTSGTRHRLLEIPRPRLMQVQRRLARHVLRRLALHPAAHGSVALRSVRSCLAEHAGSPVLVRCDLEGFFTAVTDHRARGVLTLTGADAETAWLLAGLCTAVVPVGIRSALPPLAGVDANWRRGRRLAVAHLPQGAPTSPGLANAVAFSLDQRLAALAASLNAKYTRYVDDLLFSGPARLPVGALLAAVRTISRDEGFQLAERKTAVLRAGRRQHALGAVINVRPTISRPEFDRMRAILHNCGRLGVNSQCRNRTASEFRNELQGRIAWVGSIDPIRGERLRALFHDIDWES